MDSFDSNWFSNHRTNNIRFNFKSMAQIIAFIPIRSGSKSIVDKNIKELGGKPLVAWTIESAIRVGLKPFVSSDSTEYLGIAREYGAFGLARSMR